MDSEKIKEALAGYLPEIYADNDPAIAEALAAARSDQGLSAWLDEEIAFDREFASRLKSTPVPQVAESELAKLMEAEAKEVSASGQKKSSKIIRLTVGLAAVLLLGGFLVNYFLFPPPVTFPVGQQETISDFRDQMSYFANQRFVLEKSIDDLQEAQEWLSAKGSPVYESAPDRIKDLKGMGCREIDWNGTKVSLVCFHKKTGELVHLFIVETKNLSGVEMAQLGILDRRNDRETQGWHDEKYAYLFVGSSPKISLDNLL